jgi:hypothetical protein
MLNTKSAAAAARVAKPTARKTGKKSSAKVPSHAAASGGSSGTLYSFSKRYSVPSQLPILRRPERKNT